MIDESDDASEETLTSDIQKLKEKQEMLDKEISQLIAEGYRVIELEQHISLLHEYNDIKDVSQMLLGKLGSQAQVLLGSDFEQDLPTFEIAVMVPVLPWPAETLRYHGYL
ncbi:DNA repair protein SWI5 homolog isoform X1 [Mastomys coucha]|uniref:DNA repair protein SWI5 homolog isoform X1 n=1 Tax=Mastomys coucha TaxID=35658 RepID=UPI0012627DB9|nr:DNA repair protein SWI5 homolog isoform X1 [Mastomys coucha]XP_031225674.1 DNA repair protein SWI5 homolog isoform X1 [Mastomys coucha]